MPKSFTSISSPVEGWRPEFTVYRDRFFFFFIFSKYSWITSTSTLMPRSLTSFTSPVENWRTESKVGNAKFSLFLKNSWIASTFFIGNVVGCLVGGLINQVAKGTAILSHIDRFSEQG